MNEAFLGAFVLLTIIIGKVAYRAGFDAARQQKVTRRALPANTDRYDLK